MNIEHERMATRKRAFDAALMAFNAALKEKAELAWKAFCDIMIERDLAYFDETGRLELTPKGRQEAESWDGRERGF